MNAQAKAALISYARVFVAAVLAQYLLLGKTPFDVDSHDLQVMLSAGVVALATVVFNALNPKDERYGINAPSRGASGGDVATNVA